MNSPLIDALRRAVAAAPEDVTLRLHLGETLLAAGDAAGAVAEIAVALQYAPQDSTARALMSQALVLPPLTQSTGEVAVSVETAVPPQAPDPSITPNNSPTGLAAPAVQPTSEGTSIDGGFDWQAAENQVEDLAAPMFLGDGAAEPVNTAPGGPNEAIKGGSPDRTNETAAAAFSVERTTVTLADVGGLQEVKERLQAAFLAPLRNPELRKLYGKSLRGGLLLYGPPGCGKTFIARAVAGELGAKFISVGVADILDPYIGNSERNLRDVFQLARREAPCVLFFDEVDALGQRRTQTRNNAMRGAVNQLLTELDGVDGANEGVFVLAATNQPWDVDPALRRPGRLDRTVLVLPPDPAAREAIFRYHLQQRPVEGIDLRALASRTEGFSGADISFVCELASERALLAGVRSGNPRLIGMNDLLAGLETQRPSIGPWLESARNVVLFGDDDGTYADLRGYLKKTKRL